MLENLRFDRNSAAVQRLFFCRSAAVQQGTRYVYREITRNVSYCIKCERAAPIAIRAVLECRPVHMRTLKCSAARIRGQFVCRWRRFSGGRAGRAAVCNFMHRGACDERSCFFRRHLVRHNGSARTGRIRFLPPLPFTLSNLCLHIARACDIIFRGGARSAASYSQ